MARVHQRAAARRDLIEHFVYLAENAGLDTAEGFLKNAQVSFEDLADQPRTGICLTSCLAQHSVPVLGIHGRDPFHRQVSPPRLGDQLLDDRREAGPILIAVRGDPQRSITRQAFDGRSDQDRLAGVHGAPEARVAGMLVGVQGRVAQGVDTALGDHQGGVGALNPRDP